MAPFLPARGPRLAALILFAIGLSTGAPAVAATPLEALYVSPDNTLVLSGVTVLPQSVARTMPVTLANLGSFPAGANLVAYHRFDDGEELFSLDISANLPGGVFAQPADVVALDATVYSLRFDGSARGIPPGVNVDAVAVFEGDLLLSFDTPVALASFTADPSDLVRVSAVSFAPFFDGSSAGVAPGLDLDGAEALTNGRLLLSFDGSGSLGGVAFDDDDVLEHDPVADTWELVYDGSAAAPGWTGADLDAVAASQLPTPTPTSEATFTATASRTATETALSTATPTLIVTATATETRVPTSTPPPTATQTSPSSPTATGTASTPSATPTEGGPPTATPNGATPTPTATATPDATSTATAVPGFFAGDANCDDLVNAADGIALTTLVVDGESQCGSDADCNGITDAADIQVLPALFFVAPMVCPTP